MLADQRQRSLNGRGISRLALLRMRRPAHGVGNGSPGRFCLRSGSPAALGVSVAVLIFKARLVDMRMGVTFVGMGVFVLNMVMVVTGVRMRMAFGSVGVVVTVGGIVFVYLVHVTGSFSRVLCGDDELRAKPLAAT